MLELCLPITNPGRYSLNRQRLFDVVEARLKVLKYDTKVTVSLLVVNTEEMAKLNETYHQTKGPTDVLSFPYTDTASQVSKDVFVTPEEAGVILGDIVVCYPVAREEAQKQGKAVGDLLEFYVLHGLEHLLGHHHE